MEEKELLLKEITDKVKNELSQFASKEDLAKSLNQAKEEIKETFGDLKSVESKLAEIEKAAIAQGEILNKIKINQNSERKTIKDQLLEQKDAIKKIANGDYTAKTTVINTAITTDFGGQQLPGVNLIEVRQPSLVDVWQKGALASNNNRTLRYYDETTRTDNSAARTMGQEFTEDVIAWTGRSKTVESITSGIPIALEMLEDYDFVESQIKNSLLKYLMLKLEYYLINGTGTSPQIDGLIGGSNYTAFTAATHSSKADGNSIWNLIELMGATVANNSSMKANYALINNFDASYLKLEKDDLGQFRLPNFNSNGVNWGGIKLVDSSLITTNTMLVGDFNAGTLYSTPIEITMGLNSDDFSKRKVTLLANMNACLLIPATKKAGFQYSSDVASDVQTIQKGA